MFNSNGVSLADIAAVTGNNRNNDGMWGDGAWWIVILLIFGWGGFGNNGWGNGNGMGSTAAAYTDSAIQRGFDNQAVVSKLDGISNGLCDGFYAMNNSMLTGFNGINTNIMQTGYGIQQAINADTVANMQNTNALQSQLANCCCETREAIQGVNYNMATNTCALQNTMNNNTRDIIDSQQAGTRAILDFLTNDKIATLQAENNDLRRAASQDRQNALLTTTMAAQTNQIIDAVRPTPVPSFPASNLYGYAYGCGCNTGCQENTVPQLRHGILAKTGQQVRIQGYDISHGHERGQSGQDLCADCRSVFLQVKNLLHKLPLFFLSTYLSL